MAVIRDLAESADNQKAKGTMQRKIYQEENEYEGTQASVRIKVKENERFFFRDYILTPGGTTSLKAQDKKSTKELKRLRQKLNNSENRMLDAIEVFRDRFHDSQGSVNKEVLDRYITYLLQKVVFVAVRTDSLESAFRLFKTLNKRGVEIGSADILKSENMSVIPELDRQEYARKWEDIEEDITLNNEIKLETLINFIRIIEIPGRQQRELFQDFEDKYFSKKSKEKGKGFIDYLEEVKNIYTQNIDNCEIFIDNSNKRIYYYNLMSIMKKFLIFNDWMAAVIHFREDIALFEFVKKLERIVFLDWLTGASQERRVARIYQIVKIISECENAEQVINHTIFNNEIKERKNEFSNAIDDIIFYNKGSKKLSKYTLLRLDIERTDNRNKTIDYDGEISVEHILPENPEDEYWLTRFNEDDRVEWTDRLGNLALLDGRKNSKAANKPFPDKKAYFFQKRHKSKNLTLKSSFELTNELEGYSDWSMATLMDRHIRLKNEALLVWMK
jgi:hypothetical protein